MMRRGSTTTRFLAALALVAAAATGFACKRGESAGGACVDVGGAACQACRDKTTAQFCAASYVTPQASGNIKVNGQKGCCGFEDAALRASCDNVLRCIRGQGCGAGNSPVGCLCGQVGMGACAAASDWSGPCAAVYKAALAGVLCVVGAHFAHQPRRLDAAARSIGTAAGAAAGSRSDSAAIAFAEACAGSRSRAAAFARAVAIGVRRALLEHAHAVPRVGGRRNDRRWP